MHCKPFGLARRLGNFIFLLISLTLFAPIANAFDVTLEWDANPESNIAGYTVYFGLQSRSYDASIDVSTGTQQVIQSLTPGHLYYFAVTAYDTDGLESAFSDEVTYTVNESMIATPLTNLTVYVGQPACFATLVVGLGPLAFVWKKDGTVIDGAASSSLMLATASSTDAGTYTLEISGALNSVTNAALLTVLMNETNTSLVPRNITFSSPASPVAISFLGEAGRQYMVQASGDLQFWQTIYTVTSLSNGPNKWLDAEATNHPTRFYRVIGSVP